MSMLTTSVPAQLITELESRFPPRCARVGESIAEIYEYAGRVALVRYIRESFDAQQKELLT